MLKRRFIAVATLLALWCGFAAADPAADPATIPATIMEESSHAEFPARIAAAGEGEPGLAAVGTGLRKKAWFKVYAACFYVDADVDLGSDPGDGAIHGDFAKRIVLRMLRDVDGEKIGSAFRDGIRKTLHEGHDRAIEALAGFYVEKIREGQELALQYVPGRGLRAERDGRELGWIDDGEAIAALWAVWFGRDPISEDMRRGLLGLTD